MSKVSRSTKVDDVRMEKVKIGNTQKEVNVEALKDRLNKKKKNELVEYAKKHEIKISSKDKKEVLLEKIVSHYSGEKEEEEEKIKIKINPKTKKILEIFAERLDALKEIICKKISKETEISYDSMEDYFEKCVNKKFGDLGDQVQKVFEKTPKSTVKKPKTPYLIFSNEKREEVKQKNPDFKFAEISKELGNMWKQCDEEEKEVYEKKAVEDKQRFVDEVEGMNEGNEKEKLLELVQKIKNPSAKKSSGKPKNGYIAFCSENRSKVQEENKGLKGTEITKILSSMWKELSDEEKNKYKPQKDEKEKNEKTEKKKTPSKSPRKSPVYENDREKELAKLKVSDLKELADDLQIKVAGKIKKEDLIRLIYQKENENKGEDEEEEFEEEEEEEEQEQEDEFEDDDE